ncbi:MAG: hypothetical protein P4L90_24290 [Rhodopila sp.]|nr:hypothetical protein [Rhodopila sp.]
MKPFKLARIAAEAESLRLRGMFVRIVTRGVLALVALMFVMGTVVFVHIGAWHWIRISAEQTFLMTTAILGGADLLVAIVLGLLASRSGPSRIEREALEIRSKALQGMGSALSLTQIVVPILQLLIGMRRRPRP